MIKQDEYGNLYVKIEREQETFGNMSIKEQARFAKRYILDNFGNDGLTIASKCVRVNRRTVNEYTNPRNKIAKDVRILKIRASTELDNLLEISKYKASAFDDGRHFFASDGWDYYETRFQIDNKWFKGTINIGKNGDKRVLYDITNIKRDTSLINRSICYENSCDEKMFVKENVVLYGIC